jgi:hypothetical protein
LYGDVVEGKGIGEMQEEMGDWVANDAVDESEEETDEEDHAAAAAVHLSNINSMSYTFFTF